MADPRRPRPAAPRRPGAGAGAKAAAHGERTGKHVDEATGVETTGHTWDGIRELNNPLPRWWLWTFYATTVWGIIYTVFFPAWPLVDRATAGVLGWTAREEVAADIAAVNEANADLIAALGTAELETLAENEALHRYAIAAGRSIFSTNCSQCHGQGAAGVQAAGYPNLLDDDWLWGGSIADIATTVRHGIRNELDPDARWSQMPAFGEILTEPEIAQTVAYVRSLSGLPHDGALATAGAQIFTDNCSACHAEDGAGNREVGAPDLTDAIWLYGGSEEAIEYTVRHSRFGVMPPWGPRLGETGVRAVAAYVHGLGGGEPAGPGETLGAGGVDAAPIPNPEVVPVPLGEDRVVVPAGPGEDAGVEPVPVPSDALIAPGVPETRPEPLD